VSFTNKIKQEIDIKRKEAKKTNVEKIAPHSVELQVADTKLLCPFYCKYCWKNNLSSEKNVGKSSSVVGESFWNKMVDVLAQTPKNIYGNIKTISFSSSNSEPLLYQPLAELMEKAAGIAPISFHTKLVYLPPRFLETLKKLDEESKVSYINVSLDAFDNDSYLAVHPVNNNFLNEYGFNAKNVNLFNIVLANLQQVINNTKNTQIIVSYLLTSDNCDVKKIEKMINGPLLDIGYIKVSYPFIEFSRYNRLTYTLKSSERIQISAEIKKMIGSISKTVKFIDDNPEKNLNKIDKECYSVYCPAISSFGFFLPCCQSPDIEKFDLKKDQKKFWEFVAEIQPFFKTPYLCLCDRRHEELQSHFIHTLTPSPGSPGLSCSLRAK
jgi:wyosine [tRNA(Phe)-imidazoG37] synthetase (radical SAM superfamily)